MNSISKYVFTSDQSNWIGLHYGPMLYVFVRGSQRKTCETRLSADGVGYELVVSEDGVERIDRYSTMERLLAREHELLQAWRAQGWIEPQSKH